MRSLQQFILKGVCIIFILSSTPNVSASFSGIMAPLDQLYNECDFAFTGTAGELTQGAGFYRYYPFTDVDLIKSNKVMENISIRIFGGTLGNMSLVTTGAQPSFIEGNRYLVFVNEDDGVYRVFYNVQGYYLIESGSGFWYKKNVVETRAESSIEQLWIAEMEPVEPFDNRIIAYSTCAVLFLALILGAGNWKQG